MKVNVIKKKKEEVEQEEKEEVEDDSTQNYIGQWLDKNKIGFCSTKRKLDYDQD